MYIVQELGEAGKLGVFLGIRSRKCHSQELKDNQCRRVIIEKHKSEGIRTTKVTSYQENCAVGRNQTRYQEKLF